MSEKAYAVLITSVNPERKILAIQRVREITGTGIAKAKATVESVPMVILDGLFESQAVELSELLKAAGMETEIRVDPGNKPEIKSLLQMTFESSGHADPLSGGTIVIPVAGGGKLSLSVKTPLVFPDGIRLARLEELPGPKPSREAQWARIQSANIAAGFTLIKTTDPHFGFYAEANVHAPKIWGVFYDLCRALLGPEATLVISQIDDEPTPLGSASTAEMLRVLETHKYQLAHDGWIQFGLAHQDGDLLTEVFVAPTKHFQVWLNDEQRFRSVLQTHAVPEVLSLEFINDYPRTTTPLSGERIFFHDHAELIADLEKRLKGPHEGYH